MSSRGALACEACREAFGVSHQDMVAALKRDFFLTARVLCGFPDLSRSLHAPVASYIQRRLSEGQLRFLVLFPRGHFKTSLLSIAFPIWQVINNPSVRILLLHASSTKSVEWLNLIKAKLKSEVFLHYFPELVPENPKKEGRRWSNNKIDVRRPVDWPEATITSLGVTSTIVGGHYDIQIFDDVVELSAARSPAVAAQAVEFLKLADPLFVKPNEGIRLIVGTWWPGGFYEKIVDNPAYEKIIFGCYVDERFREFMERAGHPTDDLIDGEPVFPERFTVEDLNRMELEMGSYQFTHQMLNVQARAEMLRFRESDITWYRWREDTHSCVLDGGEEIPLSECSVTLCVDPATGESMQTDESAITVCAHHRKTGHIFVLDCWAGKVLPKALIEKIIEMACRWRPRVIGIEHVGFQASLKYYLADEMKRTGKHFYVQSLTVGNRSKVERIIDGLQPYVASGQLHFRREGQERLIREMLDLSVRQLARGLKFVGRSPNRVDSLAMHVQFWGGVSSAFGRDTADEPDADIPFAEDEIPSYTGTVFGLECVT